MQLDVSRMSRLGDEKEKVRMCSDNLGQIKREQADIIKYFKYKTV